jgi:hypothetical protein
LFKVLVKFDFNANVVQWIASCVNASWITPLVNVRPTPFFQGSKGLWQGFPLSPLLYIIMAETLGKKLEEERVAGNLPGLKIVRGVKNINHSQLANNILLLGGASLITAYRFKRILDVYLEGSGGAIYKIKCQIYGWHANQ